MIKLMWRTAFPAKKSAEPPVMPSYPISFSINAFPNAPAVELFHDVANSAIVKTGRTFSYIIGYGMRDSDFNVKAFGFSKKEMVEKIIREHLQDDPFLMDKAYSIAREELSRYIDGKAAEKLSPFLAHDVVGSGPLSLLALNKKDMEEIEINSPSAPISVYMKKYGRCVTNLRFLDANSFRYNINRFIRETGKEISEDSPIIDVQNNDSRMHAQISPYARSGATASIRFGGEDRLSAEFLIRNDSLTPDILSYLWMAVASGMNIVLSGPPATGKTTLLNVLIGLIPRSNKVIAIEEDINEIQFGAKSGNVVSLYGEKGKVSSKEQVINALRLRPQCLVIGEIRSEEARDLFAGTGMGIQFMTTLHSADDPMGVIRRLITRPMNVETKNISMLDLSIHLSNNVSGRRIEGIYEYNWLSRAETEDGVVVDDQDRVRIEQSVRNSSLNPAFIFGSKVAGRYAKMRGISRKLAVKDFNKIQSFIVKTMEKPISGTTLQECIADYGYGI